MTYQVIDSDDYKASGIETLFFPGGEPHVKVPKFTGDVLFFLKTRTWADTGLGACVWDVLCNQANSGKLQVDLFIPYFPAARQDKSDGTAPRTRDLMDMLFGEGRVLTFDVHSQPDTFENIMPSALKVPLKKDVVGIIAPDAGAADRAKDFRDAFYPTSLLIQCSKKRDPHTGQLSGYYCPEIPLEGRYIIVDDICDGGGTFNLLADAFFKTKKGPKCKLEMFVSHGIFSKGLENLDKRIEHIITTNSWASPEWEKAEDHERLTVLPLNQLFNKIMGV